MSEPGADQAQRQRIMLVEDDAVFAAVMRTFLEKNGFTVLHETNGAAARGRILTEAPDAVLLDGTLPGQDGFDICREVRQHFAGPIILLTARDEDLDQVLGLELGADDYIAKPCEPRVILARLRASLRRSGRERPEREADTLRFGSLVVSRASRTVFAAGRPVELTTAEFDLLWVLASHAGSVVSREDIFNRIRGIGYDGLDRSIDMRISRLRKLLGDDPLRPARIKTVRGKGYLFSPSDWP